jgi:hypothetical protein
MSTDSQSSAQSSWDFRFAFFDAHGAPSTPEYKEAFKQLHWKERIKVGMNAWALFFGPLYLLYLGLWKKALVLYAIAFAVMFVAVLLGAPDGLLNGIGIALGILIAMSTNYAYYLKKVKNQDGWNPFEGVRWF